MATNFTTLASPAKKKEKVETVFTRYVDMDERVKRANVSPLTWENVMFLYSDNYYGDVFLAWDDKNPNDRTIYFGTKGDEFDE